MVRAKPAVTIGCRVLWFVAAVWMRIRSVTAPVAPQMAPTSLRL